MLHAHVDRCLSAAPCSKLTKGEGWSSLIAGALLKYVISIYVNHLHSIIEDFQLYGRMTKKNEMFNKILLIPLIKPGSSSTPVLKLHVYRAALFRTLSCNASAA